MSAPESHDPLVVRTKAPWGRAEDGRPLLPMGAHWTDIPELVDQYLAGIQARVDEAQPGQWFVSPTCAVSDIVCTRYAGYTRTVGRFTNMLAADLELALHAHSDLTWCLELIARLRARVVELEALKPARFQDCRKCGAGYEYGQPCSQCEFNARMAAASSPAADRIAAGVAAENRHLLYDADPDSTVPPLVDIHRHNTTRRGNR